MKLQALQRYTDNGFTLIEVVVSIILLALVVTAVFELYSNGLKAISKTASTVQATIIAESALEEILIHHDITAIEQSIPDNYSIKVKETEIANSPLVELSVKVNYKNHLKIQLFSAGLVYEKQ